MARLIDQLRQESRATGPKGARYEVSITESADNDTALEVATSIGVRAAHRDTSPLGFPCLSMLSFNLDGDEVHLLAHYRYEYLISKGYGNYLGLARLLAYVSTEAGLSAGRMTVVTGRAHVDAPNRDLQDQLTVGVCEVLEPGFDRLAFAWDDAYGQNGTGFHADCSREGRRRR